MAALYERRTGPRKISLDPSVVPATQWNPVLSGRPKPAVARNNFVRSNAGPTPLPLHDADIAFAPIHQQSRWLQQKSLTSERLTRIYLDRIEKFNPRLRCIITLTRDLALAASPPSRRRNLRGPLPRPAPRHPLGRQRSA